MDEALISVLAHGMMSSMTIVRLSLEILRRENIHTALREDVAADAAKQIELIVDVLGDLARGVPAEALELLRPVECRGTSVSVEAAGA